MNILSRTFEGSSHNKRIQASNMAKFMYLTVCVVAVSLHCTFAITEEERAAFRKDIEPIVAECSAAHGVSKDDIKSAKETSNADAVPACFFGCVFKKAGILNEQGVYDPEKGLSEVKKYVKSEADVAKFDEVGKKCASVNDQAVSDGEAGCERAKLLVACALENKAEIPL